MYSRWQQTVFENSNKLAIRSFPDGRTLSFMELQGRVERNIASIPGISGWRNRIVAIHLQDAHEWLEAFITCQAVGAIALPIDFDVPETGVRAICESLHVIALWQQRQIQAFAGATVRRPASLIKLTSGSTGEPRPLFFESKQMIADGENIVKTMGIRPDDINLATIPLGHSYALGNLVMPLILQGTAIVTSQDFLPYSLAETIHASGATIFPAVPVILDGLVRAKVPCAQLASIRTWISAGSPLKAEQAQAFYQAFGAKIHNFYGTSETGGIAYDRTGDEALSGGSIGAPLEGVQVQTAASGRLWVSSGAVVQRNNVRRHEDQAAYLVADLATVLPNGNIALVGRGSRYIKLAGKRLNLSEIERFLLSQEGVDAAYVTDYRDGRGRTRVLASVVSSLAASSITDALKLRLPAWKVPSKWMYFDAFPVTRRGKVDVPKLRASIFKQLDPQGKL
ncbi:MULTISPECIES: class I adenylate-forming enzyme family protein [unclassified Lentimonas]|uniref:class I adenylate-forming enzyme family protein n=1 Tax=unclassified Lentimonas TaxID=2630993 RepID=UPI00138A1658|nr:MULTISPECIES: class I adenylate-forming enzyme family protein [unclassified Lentimonas]